MVKDLTLEDITKLSENGILEILPEEMRSNTNYVEIKNVKVKVLPDFVEVTYFDEKPQYYLIGQIEISKRDERYRALFVVNNEDISMQGILKIKEAARLNQELSLIAQVLTRKQWEEEHPNSINIFGNLSLNEGPYLTFDIYSIK